MIEAQLERAVDRYRAAKPHAAIHRETRPAFEQQAHDLQEILVPANGDAVLGNPAESRHDAVVEPLDEARDITDRLERVPSAIESDAPDLGRQRLDLEAIDRRDEMAVVQQVMGEREARGPEADHKRLVAAVRPRQRPANVEWVPPGQQRIDLETPGEAEHVLQRAGLDLRDVDRLLALVDAGLHAVVADAVAGRRTYRVVDRDDGEGAEAVAARLHQVHFGDLLL